MFRCHYGWEVINFEVCYCSLVNLCLYWHMEKWTVGVFLNFLLLASHKSFCEQYVCEWCGSCWHRVQWPTFLPRFNLFYYNCHRSKMYFKVWSAKIVVYWTIPCGVVDWLPFQINLILIFTIIKTWYVMKGRIEICCEPSRMYGVTM